MGTVIGSDARVVWLSDGSPLMSLLYTVSVTTHRQERP